MSRALGWYPFPEPEGTVYTEEALRDPARVEELFGCCGILYALISKEGWDFLLSAYGLEELYRIAQCSLWLDSSTLEDFASDVEYERSISPDRL